MPDDMEGYRPVILHVHRHVLMMLLPEIHMALGCQVSQRIDSLILVHHLRGHSTGLFHFWWHGPSPCVGAVCQAFSTVKWCLPISEW